MLPRQVVLCLPVFGLLTLSACSSAPTVPGPATTPDLEEPRGGEWISPLDGYPWTLPAGIEQRLSEAFGVLRTMDDPAPAAAVAETLLAADPSLHPAAVLLAQIELNNGSAAAARQRLEPIATELPTYRACQLLLAVAAEQLGDIATAYLSLRRIAAGDAEIAGRAETLKVAAVQQVGERLSEDLGRGHLEEAEARLSLLESWEPTADITVAAAWRVAAAASDSQRELLAARELWFLQTSAGVRAFAPWISTPELLARLADLEVEVGDLRTGMNHLSALVAEAPEDSGLRDRAEHAKFLWRLRSLPQAVQALAGSSELSRADFATLVYWLVPRVRYAVLNQPPIASDILDHPRRDEIVRVLNLDLLRIDETLHRFSPQRRLTRSAALNALIVLLSHGGSEAACLADAGSGWRSAYAICEIAARCRLIAEAAACLPQAGVAGAELMDLLRRALDLEASR